MILNTAGRTDCDLSLDGIHLNAEGHRIMADFIPERLKTIND